MKSTSFFLITGSIALAGLSLSFCHTKAAKKETTITAGDGFAVVELFTSEGCSSCPPADETMIRLAKEFPEHVYFLGYHVDYWDQLGWKDQYSNATYTGRQQRYSDIFGANSVYTPQAIVNGEKEVVGSKESDLKNIIEQDLKNTSSLSLDVTAKKAGDNTITVSYKVSHAGMTSLNIALVQLAAVSKVKRGENSGHTLNHINIVRVLKTIPINLDGNADTNFTIPAGLSAKDCKVIAFVQDTKSLKITGAAQAVIQ